jgi:hypothetical protein
MEVAINCPRRFFGFTTTTLNVANAHQSRINTREMKTKGSNDFDGVGASRTALSTSSTTLAARRRANHCTAAKAVVSINITLPFRVWTIASFEHMQIALR